jgi:16S rRNA (adenine1518-N6/adenine1519-N6)-dimethyltransferase
LSAHSSKRGRAGSGRRDAGRSDAGQKNAGQKNAGRAGSDRERSSGSAGLESDSDLKLSLSADLSSEPLYSPRVVRALLARHGLRPTKSLGQNFLIDGNVLRHIVHVGLEQANLEGVPKPINVYEVGPGLGVLTRALAETGANVISVEKDEHLRGVLETTLEGIPNVRVVFKDALEFPWHHAPEGSLLVANLPYYISSAIIAKILEGGRFSRLTFLVQREVALRLEAQPGEDGYGFLSALVALYGRAERVFDVPKGAFFPAPDVTSSVARIHVTPGLRPAPGVIRVLEVALHHRRKTLRNNLSLAGYTPELIVQALEVAGLEPSVRAEDVPLAAIQALASVLEPSVLEPSVLEPSVLEPSVLGPVI